MWSSFFLFNQTAWKLYSFGAVDISNAFITLGTTQWRVSVRLFGLNSPFLLRNSLLSLFSCGKGCKYLCNADVIYD